MRVYLHLNVHESALLFHEVAKRLRDRHGATALAGVVVRKEGAHVEALRHGVAYEALDVVEEIEAAALAREVTTEEVAVWEARLDVPLMHLVVADRAFGHAFVHGADLAAYRHPVLRTPRFEDLVRLVVGYLDHYDRRLASFRPDAVLLPGAASLHALALVKVCQARGVPFYVLRHARVGSRHVVTRDDATEVFDAAERRLAELERAGADASKEAEALLASYRAGRPPTLGYVRSFREERARRARTPFAVYLARQAIGMARLGARRLLGRPSFQDHLHARAPWSIARVRLRREIAHRYGVRERFEGPRAGERYVLFPLHMDPEAATMVRAPYFADQAAVVEAVAKSLPMTHRLYVKDHYAMKGARSHGFYDRLRKLPNVRLIDPDADNQALIRCADAVATVTGTSAWESLLAGRPCITFGKAFYDPVVTARVTDLTELPAALSRVLAGPTDAERARADRRLALFVTALMETSFDVPGGTIWHEDLDAAAPGGRAAVADVVADRFAAAIGGTAR